ncbi:MAG: ABC transporter permease [Candidatus Sericytochromatia bacterium]|nr:ABC transporter permease [Candidatus Sericytochromatia bacterium]
MSTTPDESPPEPAVANLLATIGRPVLNMVESFGTFMIFCGQTFAMLGRGRIHWKNTIQQLAFVGTDSLGIALLTSAAVGAVFTLQIADQFIRFGAVSMVGAASGMALVRELAPLMTGVVVAGRVAAAFAAEVGSMKVTQQIDALTAMAVDPLYYLVVPRLLASGIMLPLLTILAIAVGMGGGLAVAVLIKGVIPSGYIDSMAGFLTLADFAKSIVKAFVFGIILSLVGCYNGLDTGEGARGVGISTTQAVVHSLMAIFLSNYLMTTILYSTKPT